MRPSVPALPPALQTALAPFRFVFHADTWPVFLCVLTGLLTGHTTLACVRASLLLSGVAWYQCCDFYRRARWSRTAFLRATTHLVLQTLYPAGLPRGCGGWPIPPPATSPRRAKSSAFAASGAAAAGQGKRRATRGTAGCCWPISTSGPIVPGRPCSWARCSGCSCATPHPAA